MTTIITSNKSWQNWAIIINLLVLVGLLGINYSYHSQLSDFKNQINQQNAYNNKTDQLVELNTVDNKLLNNELMAVKNIVASNIEQTKGLATVFAEFAEIKKNPDLKLKVLSIQNLINIANLKLKLDYDPKTAVAILNIADEYLKSDTQPELIALRKKIITKISLLEQLQLPDQVKIAADLEQFIAKIDKLTVLDLMQNKLTNNANISNFSTQNYTGDPNDPSWQQVLDNVRTDLFNLIRIRKVDDKDSNKIIKLLDDQQINVLKLYFKLKATQAIVSAKQRDADSYTAALTDLDKNISFYFVNNEQLQTTLLGLIRSNMNLDLTQEFPDLSDLYPAINTVKTN